MKKFSIAIFALLLLVMIAIIPFFKSSFGNSTGLLQKESTTSDIQQKERDDGETDEGWYEVSDPVPESEVIEDFNLDIDDDEVVDMK